MKLDDYLLALAAGLLARPEAEFPAALARAEKIVEMTTPRAPKLRSMGARLADGRELGLAAWLRGARAGAPRGVRVAEGARDERAGLPAHMAAGFMGSGRAMLAVADGPRRGAYAFATMPCPRTAMTPDAFARWLDRQPARAGLWAKVAEEVDRFQRMSDRPGAAPETVRGVLLSADGPAILDHHGDNLLRRVQSEMKRAGAALVFADSERALFASADPDRDEGELRVNGEISVAEFAGLVDAQEPRAAIRAALKGELANIRDGAASLGDLSAEEFRMYATMLLGAAQRAAVAAGGALRVPESLRGKVGTERDFLAPEERAGHVPGPERLQFAPNPEPWEYYALVELPGARAPEAEPLARAAADWKDALGAAERLARRMESPYAEAFRLAAFALEEPGADGAALAAAGFAENAREVWTRETATIAELGLPPENARALLSTSIGDVFGGMGSWNDQAPRDEADAAAYERVSAELFARLRALYAAALRLP